MWTLWIQCRCWVLTVFVYLFIVVDTENFDFVNNIWLTEGKRNLSLRISFNDRSVCTPSIILFIINYLSSVLFSVVPVNPSCTADERMLIPQWYLIKSKILQKKLSDSFDWNLTRPDVEIKFIIFISEQHICPLTPSLHYKTF